MRPFSLQKPRAFTRAKSTRKIRNTPSDINILYHGINQIWKSDPCLIEKCVRGSD